jgi:serine/threonine protein kinase
VGILGKLFGGGGAKPKGKAASMSRWDLQNRTGQGSMSKVYQAYDRELGRTVCLKLLDAAKTKQFEDRFLKQGLKKPSEGEVCSDLAHRNCVKTFDFGVVTKTNEPYLVMEWIDGDGLNFLVETRNKKLDGQRVNFISQLCDGVQYLHARGYMHRDLCPRNVMVAKEQDEYGDPGPGVVKLIDFGLTIPATPAFCAPGNRTGTVDYLAPEVIRRAATDIRVDLFALGVTAFEVFTGALPYERSVSSEETLRKRLNGKPRHAKELNPAIDDDLARVLMKAIEKERADRYKSAAEFKEALLGLKRQDY